MLTASFPVFSSSLSQDESQKHIFMHHGSGVLFLVTVLHGCAASSARDPTTKTVEQVVARRQAEQALAEAQGRIYLYLYLCLYL